MGNLRSLRNTFFAAEKKQEEWAKYSRDLAAAADKKGNVPHKITLNRVVRRPEQAMSVVPSLRP